MRIWLWMAIVATVGVGKISRDYTSKYSNQNAIEYQQTMLQNSNAVLPSGLACQSGASTVSYAGPEAICLGQTTGLFTTTFTTRDPNLLKPHYSKFFINEIDPDSQAGTDTKEFVELLGPKDSSLNGFVLVFFNGGAVNDVSYRSIDLDRFYTDSCGLFLVRGAGVPDPHPDQNKSDTLISASDFIQNGPDAIALYRKPSFLNSGGLPTAVDLIDAIVYHNAASPLDTALRDTLLQTVQYRDFIPTSLSRIPDGIGSIVSADTTPGRLNNVGDTSYHYVWLLTQNDTIKESKQGTSAAGFPVSFTLLEEGEFCIYGLSYYGGLTDFLSCGFVTIAQISDSITAGYCATLSDNCESLMVSGGFSILSASTTDCSSFDENGTYQVILKWLGNAEGPYLGPGYTVSIPGSTVISGDTSCFTSDPIPGGDTLYYRLLNSQCGDTVTNQITLFCDNCSLMVPPDHLADIQVCDIGPVFIQPHGGGIPQLKPAADLFFSEYVEGSSNNKCLELYNGTGDTIDLAAEQYRVSIYFNGDTNLLAQGIIDLTGKIAPAGTFVLCHNQVNLPTFVQASNQLSANLDFNGDDFIKLTHHGILIDAIGQLGFDPGSQWGSGLQSTQDNTLRRYSQVCKGDTDSTDVFVPSDTWAGFPINDSAGIGSHTYTAMENFFDYYKFYDGDPLTGGNLLDTGHTYTTTVTAGANTTIYYTAFRQDYVCESTSDSVRLLSTKSNLVCNDMVHVSLPVATCQKVITGNDVLQNPGNCSFPVLLTYPYGTTVFPAGNVVDRSHLGYKMIYSVKDLYGNSCWGYLITEDKSATQYQCSKDTISCFELGQRLSAFDSVVDGCSGPVRYVQQLMYSDSACDHIFLGRMIRSVTATDQWQNSSTCTDTFLIKKSTFPEVMSAENLKLNCDLFAGYPATLFVPESLLQYQIDGLISEDLQVVPFIDTFDIYPSPKALCNLKATYQDVVFPLCGNGMVIRREWDILDWCTLRDTFLIQYIHVEDLAAPRASVLSPILEANAAPHDCYGVISRYRRQSFSDCSDHTDAMYYEYADPAQNGKIIRIEGEILDPIRLPIGQHVVTFTSVDACDHYTVKLVPAVIYDITPPTPVCDSHLVTTVDPAVCWSRIYARDLDQGSKDNCQTTLHFAVATMDSILYWQKYWSGYLEQKCGKADYWNHNIVYKNLIEHWINCYVFADFVDLTSCVDKQVVLRVYEADFIPKYDEHNTLLTNHLWYCISSNSYSSTEINYSYYVSGYKSISRPSLDCIDSLHMRYFNASEFDPMELNLPGQMIPAYCSINLFDSTILLNNGCSGARFNDCMTTVTVVDKTPPVATTPHTIELYCDGAKFKYAEDICSTVPDTKGNFVDFECTDLSNKAYNEIECSIENDGTLTDALDPTGSSYGYYRCSKASSQIHDQENHNACQPGQWSPVYCHRWLCEDRYDYTLSNVKDLFSQPKYGSNLVGENDDLVVTDNCDLDSMSTTTADDQSIQACGTGWYRRTWSFKDRCGNVATVSQKIIVQHRSDFEVIFPEDVTLTCAELPSLGLALAGRPIITDDECELVSAAFNDLRYDIISESCFKILRTWTLLDECVWTSQPHNQHSLEVIVNDTLTANRLDRGCIYRNLKDGGDGYMQYVQIIKVIDTVAPHIVLNDSIICINNELCASGNIDFKISLVDDCDPLGQGIKIEAYVDLDATQYAQKITDEARADMKVNLINQSLSLDHLAPGTHLILLKAQDLCGNISSTISRLEIKDCKPPTPYCFDQLSTVIMPASGMIQIWAKDFDAGSYDNCTIKQKLKFSFSPSLTDSSTVIGCKDLLDGTAQTFPLDIWVVDAAGNKDYCKTGILIRNNLGRPCDTIAGTLRQNGHPKQQVTSLPISPSETKEVNFIPGLKHSKALQLSVFPNPFLQSAVISIEVDDQPLVSYSIVDIQGREIKKRISVAQGIRQISVHKTDLPGPGVYFCRMMIGQKYEIVKLVLME